MKVVGLIGIAAAMAFAASAARSTDLYRHDNWAAMASDRQADQVGDILTVLVLEDATAIHSAANGNTKATRVNGQANAGNFNESAGLNLNGRFDGNGQTTRSGRMVAQISTTVQQVLPNGDLFIAGEQHLNINGEKTFIRLRGRVRRADIRDNTVASSRIADAEIDYDGSGYVSRSTRPGLITRIFNFLGLL